VILIYKEEDFLLKRSVRNIPWAQYMSCHRMNAHDLFYAKEIVITKDAALELNSFLLKSKGGNN
jgi:large subunit ribosomal protein L4